MRRRDLLTLAGLGVPLAAGGAVPARAAAAGRGHITGLLAREPDKVTEEGADRLTGFVVRLNWADAQLTAGGAISDKAKKTLEDALELAGTYGYPRLKLRLVAGYQSPGWALNLGKGPLRGWNDDDELRTVPRWWDGDFLNAYAEFVHTLSGQLSDQRWCEVTVSGTCTVWAEPCIHQLGVARNRSIALAAAYTVDDDLDAFRTVITDQHAILGPLGISSSVAYNPMQVIVDGAYTISDQRTLEIMEFQRGLAGAYGVWENNSLIVAGGEQTRGDYAVMYQRMTERAAEGHPVQFQTATLAKIEAAGGTVRDTAAWVARKRGISVELPQGWEHGKDSIDAGTAGQLNEQLAANDRGTP